MNRVIVKTINGNGEECAVSCYCNELDALENLVTEIIIYALHRTNDVLNERLRNEVKSIIKKSTAFYVSEEIAGLTYIAKIHN